MTYEPASADDLEGIRNLLKQCALPFNDLEEHLKHFIVAKQEKRVVGCIGMEMEGPLLRSLAVDPDYRSHGIAKNLYARLVEHAKREGAQEFYLLTETAATFFEKAGFDRIDRERAPERIRQHKQFRELCPSSAVLMWKEI